MSHVIFCRVLKKEATALAQPPHPGELGQRIFESVSEQGWQKWLERLTMIINEYGLSTADPRSIDLIEKHMEGFFFGEGEFGQMPDGFRPAGQKK